MLFIGVKPVNIQEVLPKVAKVYSNKKVCVSMAAGISIDFIKSYLGDDAQVVRIMPNTPAKVKEAMISVSTDEKVKEESIKKLMDIFSCIGKVALVDEKLIHAVIGVSGSSTAYTYMYINSLIKGAMKNGMKYEDAKLFASQAVIGAAKMVLENDMSPDELKENVCSKGGTTIEAVQKLEELNFEEIILEGCQAAVEKSRIMEK